MEYIREEEIVKNNITIFKASIDLDKYDMYYINFQMKDGRTKTVKVFCEKDTFPDFQGEEFKKLQRVYGVNITGDFFVKRLIGPNGLMAKEKREDYIYLGGELGKNGYIANRYIIQSNGKTGQQNFDDNLFRLKLQVEAKEKNSQNAQNFTNNYNQGKTYVTGDIHGMYGSYMEIMKRMTVKDRLIILGDVIDRGNGGIQIIQDIIKRKQEKQGSPEIIFLLGNHEMQFLETIEIMINRGLHREDLISIINWRRVRAQMGYYSLYSDEHYKQQYEYWKNEFNKYNETYTKLIREKGLTDRELETMGIWLNSNQGDKTIFDFLIGGRVKDVKEQNEIYKFLCDSYVVWSQTISNQDYLFVHAMPPKDFQMLNNIKQTKKGYKYTELLRNQSLFMLQERDNRTYEMAKQLGFTTICGHTPEYGIIQKDENEGFIRIDAGCGHKQPKSKLALYCVDDGSTEYFDEIETTQGPPEL